MSRYLAVTSFNGKFVCVRRFPTEEKAIRHAYKECAKIEYMETDMECRVLDAWAMYNHERIGFDIIWCESHGV